MLTTGLPVTNWIEEWRASEKEPNQWAIRTVADTIVADVLSARRSDGKGRFRPSMIGNDCGRAQALSYLGFEQTQSKPEWEQMADAGTWLHYKWQYEGMAAGWIVESEVQIEIPEWELTGSADGLCVDDSIFELKTLGTDKYMGRRGTFPVSKWHSPQREHIRQVHAYMKATGTFAASIVYMDRDSNAFREFRVLWDPAIYEEMDTFVKSIQSNIYLERLPPILSGCSQIMESVLNPGIFDTPESKKAAGRKFNFCNYRNVCEHATFPQNKETK